MAIAISSPMVLMGLPTFWDSRAPRASASASSTSARASRAALRSAGVVAPHSTKASAAACTAASTSAASLDAALGHLLAGRRIDDGVGRPVLTGSTHCPPMKFCSATA